MAKKKKRTGVEAWELFDINAPDEETVQPEKSSGRVSVAKKVSQTAQSPSQNEDRIKARARRVLEDGAAKQAKEPARPSKEVKKDAPAITGPAPSDTKKASPEESSRAEKDTSPSKPAPAQAKVSARTGKADRAESAAKKEKTARKPVKKSQPRKRKLTPEEIEREKKRKAHLKREEEKFRLARKELGRRRKAARRALARRSKEKRNRIRSARPKRGFFRSVWALYDWFYTKTTNPEEKENNLKPRIFGRTLTYTGFMILMVLLTLTVFLVLNNRTVGIEREEVVVTGISDDFSGYNVLVISDLNAKNFGENQGTLQRLLDGENYSLVLMLGDMVGPSGDTEPFYKLIDLFVGLRKPVYFIAGDSDPAPLLETPRDADLGLTWREMVLSDWVLGAIEHGAIYLDRPVSITKGASKMWLVPDTYLNLNVGSALDQYKDAYLQEQDAYLAGVNAAKDTLPLTYYRRNLLDRTRDNIIKYVSDSDLIIMLSHEVPSDSQLNVAQEARSSEQRKNFFPSPDVIFAGHYCGGEWKLPLIGTLYADSSVLSRYGWFPEEDYVQGQRSVGGTAIYVTPGLGNNSKTAFSGRLNNPPKVSLITLTGELPSSFLD